MSFNKQGYYNVYVVGVVSGIFAFALGMAMALYSESILQLTIAVAVILLSFVFDIVAILSYNKSLEIRNEY